MTTASLESLLDPSTDPAATPAATPTPAKAEEHVEAAVVEEASPAEPAADAGGEETADVETGEEPAAAEPAPQQDGPKPQVPSAKGRTPKADAPPASEDDDLPRDAKGLRAALKAERLKRQEKDESAAEAHRALATERQRYQEADNAARQYAAMLQQLQQPPQQPQPEAAAPPDPEIDPAGALRYRDEQIIKALQDRDERFQREIYTTRVLQGQRAMRAMHADYEDMEAIATEYAKRDPRVRAAIVNHPDPAAASYEIGQELMFRHQVQQHGSLPGYVQAQARAMAEQYLQHMANEQAKQTAPASAAPGAPSTPTTPKAPPPQSLASVTSAVPRNPGSKAYEPSSLEALLAPK